MAEHNEGQTSQPFKSIIMTSSITCSNQGSLGQTTNMNQDALAYSLLHILKIWQSDKGDCHPSTTSDFSSNY
jgi:hypothetical protein